MLSKLNEKATYARMARELALQLVYQKFVRQEDASEEIFDSFAVDFAAPCEPSLVVAHMLFFGVTANMEKLEDMLLENLIGWRPERISLVDKAVIFIALYEIYFKEDSTPVAVAIDEAVELAKRYGGDDSGRFVNGVLGNIVRENKL